MASEATMQALAERGPSSGGPKLWERLPNETDEAWRAFEVYRDLGPTRTFPAVAEQIGRAVPTLWKHSAKYAWPARATAYDDEETKKQWLWMQEERKKSLPRQLQQARLLASKGIAGLALLDVSKLSPTEMLRYVEVSMRMERDILGMSETRVAVSGAIDVQLSPSDAKVRLEALQREIQTRLTGLSDVPSDDVVDAEVVEEEAVDDGPAAG